MKKVLIGIGLVLVLIVFGVYWLLGSLDGIVKNQIEAIGSELTGTRVGVGGVDIELTDGAGTITGLTVANPSGYKSNPAFSMNLLKVGIDLASIGKSPLVLNELIIDAPLVTMEMNAKGASNLKEISDNVAANTASADDEAAKAQADTGREPMRILIRKLLIKDVRYAVRGSAVKDVDVSGTLPAISMNNVGGSNGGTPGEIGKVIIRDLSERVIKQAAKEGIQTAVEDKIKKEVGGGLGDALKKLGN
jgi:hypothetical protein